MAGAVIALPVSVEQIALAVQGMSKLEQLRLLDLAPDLYQLASQAPVRTFAQAQASVEQLRSRLLAFTEQKSINADEPFWGNLTLNQYEALPEEEKAKLWASWAEPDLMELAEREVSPDALPA